jgi:hypothetical protein
MQLCTFHRIEGKPKSLASVSDVYSADLPGFASLQKREKKQKRVTAWGNGFSKPGNRVAFDYQCYKLADNSAALARGGSAAAQKSAHRRRVYAAFKEADEKEAREISEVEQVKNERKHRLKKKFAKRAQFEAKQKEKGRQKTEKHFRKIVDGWLGPGERNTLVRKVHREKKVELAKRRDFLRKKAAASGATFDPDELLRQIEVWKNVWEKAVKNRAYQTPGTPKGHVNAAQLRVGFKGIKGCLDTGEHVKWCLTNFGGGGYIDWDGFLEFNENRFAKVKVYEPPKQEEEELKAARDKQVAGAPDYNERAKKIAALALKRDEVPSVCTVSMHSPACIALRL